MNRKTLLSILILFLLCGCNTSVGSIDILLDRYLNDALTSELQEPSFIKECYRYYTDPSVGRISATRTSNTFMKEGHLFVMNLRVGSVISRRYYGSESSEAEPLRADAEIVRKEGTYIDYSGAEYGYLITASRLDEGVILRARTQFMDFAAVCGENDIGLIAGEMLKIARTVSIDEDQILSAYSTREAISYTGETVTLFENIAPENGMIEELFIDANTAGDTGSPEDQPAGDDAAPEAEESGMAEEEMP